MVHTSLNDLVELSAVSSYGVIIRTMFFLSRRFFSLLNPKGGCTIFGISSAAVNFDLGYLPFGVVVSPLPSAWLVGGEDVWIFLDRHPSPNSIFG